MSIDFTSFKDERYDPKKPESKAKGTNVVQWWKATEGEDLANAVFGQVHALLQSDKGRLELYNQNTRLYGNQVNPAGSFGLTPGGGSKTQARDRIAFNVIQSCTDTLTSKIAKNKPKPFFLTSKGDAKVQRKAKKLDEFATGVFYENNAYQMMPRQFADACVIGDGVIHVFAHHGRVKWERVYAGELMADQLESHLGRESTKTLHRIKNIDRTTLIAMFPDKEAVINRMPSTADTLGGAYRSVSDTVMLIESWRLPSAPGEADGVHCISAPGVSLLYDGAYDKDFFPFAILSYSPRLFGPWAQSLAEQLTPIQTELNRCLMSVQRSLYLGGTFKVLLHAGSKVVDTHLDNTVGAIIKWTGEHPPSYITPPLVQPEIYQQIQALKQMAYEQSGISQLSAASQKPAGLNSGKALRETIDIETDRFQTIGQAYEENALTLSRLSISVAKDIAKDQGSAPVKVPGKKFLATIDWKDIDLDDDAYVMQIFPVSKLPSDPEGRLETIQEMMQAGLIQPEVGRRLLDYPDLDAEENLANAQLDYVHQILDAMVEDGKQCEPDPIIDPMLMMKMAVEYYCVGLRDNLEEDKMDLLRDFIKACGQVPGQGAPQSTPPAPGAAQPQAVPEAPPTSNLLPNAPGGAAA